MQNLWQKHTIYAIFNDMVTILKRTLNIQPLNLQYEKLHFQ